MVNGTYEQHIRRLEAENATLKRRAAAWKAAAKDTRESLKEMTGYRDFWVAKDTARMADVRQLRDERDAARAWARLWKEAAKVHWAVERALNTPSPIIPYAHVAAAVDIPDRITGQDDYDFYAAKLGAPLPRTAGIQAERYDARQSELSQDGEG